MKENEKLNHTETNEGLDPSVQSGLKKLWAVVNDAATAIESLRQENSRLSEECAVAKDFYTDYEKQNIDLKKELLSIEGENASLIDKIQRLESRAKEQDEKLSRYVAIEKELNDCNSRYTALKQDYEQLGINLSRIPELEEKLENEQKKSARIEEEKSDLEHVNARLEETTRDYAFARMELIRKNHDINNLSEKINDLKNQLAELENKAYDLENLRVAHTSLQQELKTAIAEKEKVEGWIYQLQSEIAEEKGKSQADSARYEREILRLKKVWESQEKSLKESSRNIYELKQHIKQQEKQAAELFGINNTLTEENTGLKSALDESARQLEELKLLLPKFEAREEEIKSKDERIDDLIASCGILETRINELIERNETLDKWLKETELKSAALEEDARFARTALESANNSLRLTGEEKVNLENKVMNLIKEKSDLSTRLSEIANNISDAESLVSVKNEMIDMLNRKIDRYESEKASARKSKQALIDKIEKYLAVLEHSFQLAE